MEVFSGEAPVVAEGERDDVLPESTLEVVVRSPEIQDVEPIRSAPMSGAATSSRGGIELLADEVDDPAAVAPLGGDAPRRAMNEGELSIL
jgi:hypothetical protein